MTADDPVPTCGALREGEARLPFAPEPRRAERVSEALSSEEDVIHRDTRAKALEDGVLLDVSGMAREAGVKVPVAMTQRVWAEIVTPPVEGQSVEGRLWDVLWMFATAARAQGGSDLLFQLLVDDGRGPRRATLRAVWGPGDGLEPVVTIMVPGED